MTTVVWAKLARPLDGMPNVVVGTNNDLVAVELPANCVVTSADHIGLTTADLARVLDLAIRIGDHWRDQDGVNGALLDELAMVTSKAQGRSLAVVERESADGAHFVRDLRIIDPMPPPPGEAASKFPPGMYQMPAVLSALAANTLADDMDALRKINRERGRMLDDAVACLMSLGHLPTEMEIVCGYVADRGEVQTIKLNGKPVFEAVTTSPGIVNHGDRYTIDFTVACRWVSTSDPSDTTTTGG